MSSLKGRANPTREGVIEGSACSASLDETFHTFFRMKRMEEEMLPILQLVINELVPPTKFLSG